MIGYLDVQQLGPAGYLGGLLVVDDFGLPVEFRHTLALQPTKLQKTLYGDALDRYLRAAVIAVRLLDDLDSRPGVVLTSDPILAVGGDALPVAAFERSGVGPIGPAGTLQPFDGANPGLRAAAARRRAAAAADLEGVVRRATGTWPTPCSRPRRRWTSPSRPRACAPPCS